MHSRGAAIQTAPFSGGKMIRLNAQRVFYEWNPKNQPVVSVQPGEILVVETNDCFSETLTEKDGWNITSGEVDVSLLNPITGPIWVEGAEPGDILAITIEKIQFKPYAVIANRKNCGILGEQFERTTYKYMRIEKDQIWFDDRLSVPVRPMVGVIGVTPVEPISTRKMGDWGGNMDNSRIGEGATLYLPVQVEGALFGIGDLHACMGDGEMNGSAMEAGGYVTLKASLIKKSSLKRPAILDETHFYTTATARDVMTAIKYACEDMLDTLACQTGKAREELAMLMSGVGDMQICVACSPETQTVRFAMPRKILEFYAGEFKPFPE